MDILYSCCCGLDIHKRNVTACLIVEDLKGRSRKEVRTFGTMTDELLALADWLAEAGCTHVAMESTRVYWKPIYNLLEATFTLLLVNAQHIKAVPGRKTDARDCEWIAGRPLGSILQHGLLRGSFVPTREQRELRELVRYRTALVRERADEVNRLQKTLEGANIKLASVATGRPLGRSWASRAGRCWRRSLTARPMRRRWRRSRRGACARSGRSWHGRCRGGSRRISASCWSSS